MKLLRMFEIIYLLLERKKMTTNELATHFEVSKRTILRDIEALAMVGMPIYTIKGREGGVSLIDTFILNKQLLSKEEQQQILLGLQTMLFTNDSNASQTLKKMETLFADNTMDWLSVDVSRWGSLEMGISIFTLIKKGILNEQMLIFDYANSSGTITKKKVYPLKLVFKASSWYLQAYCISSCLAKTYKLNRMVNVSLGRDRFSRREYDIPKIDTSEIAEEELVAVEILFSAEVIFRAYDEFAPAVIQPNGDGTALVSTLIPENQWLYSFLLSLGGLAKVLAPEKVKKELIRQMVLANDLYSF